MPVRLWEEVQALLWRANNKLNPGWLHKKLGPPLAPQLVLLTGWLRGENA